METEFGAPLLGKLAAIPSFGEIDLCLDLLSGHLGTLGSYITACLRKRKPDWCSDPVLAAGSFNPAYRYTDVEAERWTIPEGGGAARRVIATLTWGDTAWYNDALDGYERFIAQEGVYAEQRLRLLRKSDQPVAFFQHVSECSSLASDRSFAVLASRLLSQFANQSASERMNKYIGEIHSTKRTKLGMDKGEKMLEVKMDIMQEEATQRLHDGEQRHGATDLPTELRQAYLDARSTAAREAEAKQVLANLQLQRALEEGEMEEGDELPIVNARAADAVLEELEASLRVPVGFRCADPSAGDSLDVAVDVSLLYCWPGMGWIRGRVTEVVTSPRSKYTHRVAFADDDGRITSVILLPASHTQDGGDDSWQLLLVVT